jgi:nuclear pore complex protein Nup155
MAINSDDELFHRYLYDWHVNRGLAEQLLEVSQLSRDHSRS